MSLLPILEFPDQRLKKIAEDVTTFDHRLQKICKDMLETMYENHGVGLAATQVGINQRLFVMDTTKNKDNPRIFINPQIVSTDGELIWEEGCLSFPGVYAKVKRAKLISVQFCDINQQPCQVDAQELESVCIQHEIDHLDGITFFDHLSKLKQNMILKKLQKNREKAL